MAEAPAFLCDSMLGGLARKLRLAGYDAAFAGPIDDGALVARAATTGEFLLSSDAPLFDRKPLRTGTVPALFVPRTRPMDQAAFVLAELALPVREPRCLACGGEVVDVDKASVRDRVPEHSYRCFDAFYTCARCQRVFWQGSHWDSIEASHRLLEGRVEAAPRTSRAIRPG